LQANAIIESPFTRIYGATRIKQFAAAQTFISQNSQVVGSPEYDDKYGCLLSDRHLLIVITGLRL